MAKCKECGLDHEKDCFAKSAAMKRFAKKAGMKIVDIKLPKIKIEDLLGIPILQRRKSNGKS